MLTNKEITITADSIVNRERVATFGAIVDSNNVELSMAGRYFDKDSYKEYREVVGEDQAAFEEYAYEIQDMLNSCENSIRKGMISMDQKTCETCFWASRENYCTEGGRPPCPCKEVCDKYKPVVRTGSN